MSNEDEAKGEVLARELGELRAKYSQLEQSFIELKKEAALNEQAVLNKAQALGPVSGLTS